MSVVLPEPAGAETQVIGYSPDASSCRYSLSRGKRPTHLGGVILAIETSPRIFPGARGGTVCLFPPRSSLSISQEIDFLEIMRLAPAGAIEVTNRLRGTVIL